MLEEKLLAFTKIETPRKKMIKFTSSNLLYDQFHKYFLDMEQEVFVFFALDIKNRVMGGDIVAIGGVMETIVDMKVLFRKIFTYPNVVSIVLMHNHPSGDSNYSPSDVKLTDRIKAGCEILGLNLLDHIIIGEEEYCSLRNEGKL